MGGKEPDLELSTNTLKKDNNSQNRTSNVSARKNKLKTRITNIDEKNHRDFLASLPKESLWLKNT